MSVLECSCGYCTYSDYGMQRHLSRAADETHALLPAVGQHHNSEHTCNVDPMVSNAPTKYTAERDAAASRSGAAIYAASDATLRASAATRTQRQDGSAIGPATHGGAGRNRVTAVVTGASSQHVRAATHSIQPAAAASMEDDDGDAIADAWQDVQQLVDRLPSDDGSDMSCSEGPAQHARRDKRREGVSSPSGRFWQRPASATAAVVGRQLGAMRAAAVAAASSGRGPSGEAQPQDPGFPVEAVEAVLLWHDPWLSARVFGAGLYALICWAQLAKGVKLFQPSTAIAAVFLVTVTYLLVLDMWRGRAGQQGLTVQRRQHSERRLKTAVAAKLVSWAAAAAPVAAAVVACGRRHLSGHDRVAMAWLAVVLWLYMALGETRVLSQPRMAMVAWAALFGLPPAYVRFRALAHAIADELSAALAAMLAAGGTGSLAIMAAAGIVTFAAVGGSLLLRVPLALAASVAVVVWRASQTTESMDAS